MTEEPACRFGCGPAAVRVGLDRGCVCWPDDRQQDLCAQHAHEVEPLGGCVVIRDYTGARPDAD